MRINIGLADADESEKSSGWIISPDVLISIKEHVETEDINKTTVAAILEADEIIRGENNE